MNTEASDPKNSEHAQPHPGPAPSPLRLVILLSILVVIAGALIYDWMIAPPQVRAAYDKLLESAHKHNEFGVKTGLEKGGDKNGATSAESRTGGMLYKEDIQQILGMSPTKVEKTDLYTIEHYCWWGWIPRNGNYITVLYIGDPNKPHYSTHYANEMPEDEAIPGRVKREPAVEQTSDAGKTPSAASPPGMNPGMGPPGGGGKGKGRPQGQGNKKISEQNVTESGGKKGDEPAEAGALKKNATGEAEKEKAVDASEKDTK